MPETDRSGAGARQSPGNSGSTLNPRTRQCHPFGRVSLALLGYALASCLACSPTSTVWTATMSRRTAMRTFTSISPGSRAEWPLAALAGGEVQMRNTKPPLLFWQGIVATDWGSDWTLWQLRCPSVVYTLLTGLMVYLLGVKLSGRRETGFLGLLIFLAFFSTYRYGRPFLTDAPVVFWLFLPVFVLLYWQPLATQSRFLDPYCWGRRSAWACSINRSRWWCLWSLASRGGICISAGTAWARSWPGTPSSSPSWPSFPWLSLPCGFFWTQPAIDLAGLYRGREHGEVRCERRGLPG